MAVVTVATEAVMAGVTAAEAGDGEDGVGTATPIGVGMVTHIGEDLLRDILSVLP